MTAPPKCPMRTLAKLHATSENMRQHVLTFAFVCDRDAIIHSADAQIVPPHRPTPHHPTIPLKPTVNNSRPLSRRLPLRSFTTPKSTYDAAMPLRITRYEPTPNPNALKCWLDAHVSDRPQSFLNADMASDHPLASALFDTGVITTLLFNGAWMTINKTPASTWTTTKRRVEAVLAESSS